MNTTWIRNNYPYILTGVGLGGMFAATGLAIAATPKVDKALKEKRNELKTDKLPPKEITKIALKYYWPALTVSMISSGCIVGGTIGFNYILRQKTAALTTMTSALSSSEAVSQAFQSKVVEKLGEEETEKIKKEAVKEVFEESIVPIDIFEAKRPGEETYLEPWTGQYFNLNPIDFLRAKSVVNDRLYQGWDGEVPLRDLFYEWKMKHADVGDVLYFRQSGGPLDYDTVGCVDKYGRAYQTIRYLTKVDYEE